MAGGRAGGLVVLPVEFEVGGYEGPGSSKQEPEAVLEEGLHRLGKTFSLRPQRLPYYRVAFELLVYREACFEKHAERAPVVLVLCWSVVGIVHIWRESTRVALSNL